MPPHHTPNRHPRNPRQPRQPRRESGSCALTALPSRALQGRIPTPAPHAAAFTLIEMLVTVGIIVVLMSIGLVVGSRMQANARLTEARTLLLKVQTVADEYHDATADRRGRGVRINHSAQTAHGMNVSAPIDWSPQLLKIIQPRPTDQEKGRLDTDDDDDAATKYRAVERFVWAVWQLPRARDLLTASVSAKHLRDTDGNGFPEIIDPWDKPLFYAAFVDHDDNITFDDFLPQRKGWKLDEPSGYDYRAAPDDVARWRPFFVSAGPSGRFGDDQADFTPYDAAKNDADRNGIDDRADNLFSHDLERTADEQADDDALND